MKSEAFAIVLLKRFRIPTPPSLHRIPSEAVRNVSTVLRQPSRKMSVQKLFRHTAVEKPWTAAAAWKTLRLPPGLRVYTPRC